MQVQLQLQQGFEGSTTSGCPTTDDDHSTSRPSTTTASTTTGASKDSTCSCSPATTPCIWSYHWHASYRPRGPCTSTSIGTSNFASNTTTIANNPASGTTVLWPKSDNTAVVYTTTIDNHSVPTTMVLQPLGDAA